MKKTYRIAVFVAIIAITAITLTSGISKENSGGERNLVDELYSQAVKQNDNLRLIEDDIDRFNKKRDEALDKFYSFVSYNNRYYSDAKAKAATIAGAASRQSALDIINKSEARYNSRISDWQVIITSLDKNEKELSDLHALLKIFITEPMIDKYQTTALPDNAKAKEANGDLMKVIEKIKNNY
jgi:hypothetical protein